MSSTNRGYDRHKSDYYVTPVEEINKFLDKFLEVENFDLNSYKVLDPCAAGDEEHDMSYPKALLERGLRSTRLWTLDIRKDSKALIKEDYLSWDSHGFNFIITNPPFNIAEGIIKKAIDDVEAGGYVIMLLRLNYFGSKKRNEWLLNNMPKSCYIHAKRLSFTDDGKTDSIEYCHFVWQKGNKSDFTKTYLLEY